MAAALLDLLGGDQLPAVEQAWAAAGGAAGLAPVLATVLVADKGRPR